MPSTSDAATASLKNLKSFFLSSRPKTWIAGISPVFMGITLVKGQPIHFDLFLLTLLFSLFIQIGTNFANDYFDFVKGADNFLRFGPKRAVQQGWISSQAMLRMAMIFFAFALLIAIPLINHVGLWSLPIAILCVIFGFLYTGGPKPLGYLGLGELLVFIFFGPVAVCGTYFLQTLEFNGYVFLASFAPGFLSTSILIANNLRDEISDRASMKKTLVVRFGHRFGCWEYALSIAGAAMIPLLLFFLNQAPVEIIASSLSLMISFPFVRRAFSSQDPKILADLLPKSALLLFIYTILFCLAV